MGNSSSGCAIIICIVDDRVEDSVEEEEKEKTEQTEKSGEAQKIASAILDLVRSIVGAETHQFEIATLLGEDPSTLSKVLTGKNQNATRPLRWIRHWNQTHPKKILLSYDGENVRVGLKKTPAKTA